MSAQVGVLTAVAAPLYPSMDFYPSSPIHNFPPPVPMRTTTSLRARCGVTMWIQLPALGMPSTHDAWSPKGHVQPQRNALPRRRKVKRFTIIESDNDDVEKKAAAKASSPKLEVKVDPFVASNNKSNDADVATSKPKSEQGILVNQARVTISYPPIESPYIPSINTDDSHLQLLAPNVFMAFSHPSTLLADLPGYSSTEPYTHVVHVDIGEETEPSIKQVSQGSTQHLHLILPASSSASGTSRAGLDLTDAHLRAARDFMAEAQPLVDNNTDVRILVTAPHGRQTDVVSIAACYHAFVTGKSMDDVLRFIDSEEDFSSTWKGEVTENEAERVEKIARSWSWLSNIIRPEVRN